MKSKSRTHKIQNRFSMGYRSIALLLVLLFLAGSARQLIPNMCATQRLAKEHTLPKTSGPILGACCTVSINTHNDEGISDREVRNKFRFTPCAFCNLVATHTVVTATVKVILPRIEIADACIPWVSIHAKHIGWRQSPLRGPPAPVVPSIV
ncbi:MAG: hypothetical protein COA73_14025 [Candidatus Hydrogenedentota bacterium]|nr:MAG: hypothetical protein COA73_14025 [Candidatus Hydrogenedentota bacterium]